MESTTKHRTSAFIHTRERLMHGWPTTLWRPRWHWHLLLLRLHGTFLTEAIVWLMWCIQFFFCFGWRISDRTPFNYTLIASQRIWQHLKLHWITSERERSHVSFFSRLIVRRVRWNFRISYCENNGLVPNRFKQPFQYIHNFCCRHTFHTLRCWDARCGKHKSSQVIG